MSPTQAVAYIDPVACFGCAECLDVCNPQAPVVGWEEAHPFVKTELCIGCGLCVPGCPQKAITLIPR